MPCHLSAGGGGQAQTDALGILGKTRFCLTGQPFLAREADVPGWLLPQGSVPCCACLHGCAWQLGSRAVLSLFAGLLGIGGGMIISPLLLAFDTHPRVAAATSTLMVLFSASSAALSFGFSHALNLQFALVFGLCCMVASLAGVLIVQRVVQRSGKVRPSCPALPVS